MGYENHWGISDKLISYKDKIVLDLGADIGSTAIFFLKYGAKKVIAVEGDEDKGKQLINSYQASKTVIPLVIFLTDPKQLERLIVLYKPDVIKVDIEGAEMLILEVDRKIVASVREWLIEAHSDEIDQKLQRMFLSYDYTRKLLSCKSQGKDWVMYYVRN